MYQILSEASVTSRMLRDFPTGNKLATVLHRNAHIKKNQAYNDITANYLDAIKSNSDYPFIVVFASNKGCAAILVDLDYSSGKRCTIFSTNDPIVEKVDRLEDALEIIDTLVKNPEKVWMASLKSSHYQMGDLYQNYDQDDRNSEIISAAFNRLIPYIQKSLPSMIEDIKGRLSMLIKNENYEKSLQFIRKIRAIEQAVENPRLLTTAHIYELFEKALMSTGDYYGDDDMTSEEKISIVTDKIRRGDIKTLATLVYFFKMNLVQNTLVKNF